MGPFEDDCEATCRVVARELEECLEPAEWTPLGAEDSSDWRNLCQDDWEDMRRDLSDLERDQALESCAAMLALARGATCEELANLYRPVPG